MYRGALAWLKSDRVAAGQRKAEKVGGRFAGQGLIGVSVLSRGIWNGEDLGVRAAMVEVNCETDFVARNELFRTLAENLAFTVAFIAEPRTAADEPANFLRPIELSHLQEAPLVLRAHAGKSPSMTVSEAIRDAISAVGENINFRRAAVLVREPTAPASGLGLRATSYVHGSLNPRTLTEEDSSLAVTEAGEIGALIAIGLKTSPASRLRELLQNAAFNSNMKTLERALARQIVGLNPDGIRGNAEDALYNQTFDMLTSSGGQSVEEVLLKWAKDHNMGEQSGLGVVDFLRWEVGEGL